jgi:putative addiction module component (TIGR02574 family)
LPLILRSFLVDNADEAWDAEVARRIEDLKAGKAVTVPWEELHRELLALE